MKRTLTLTALLVGILVVMPATHPGPSLSASTGQVDESAAAARSVVASLGPDSVRQTAAPRSDRSPNTSCRGAAGRSCRAVG